MQFKFFSLDPIAPDTPFKTLLKYYGLFVLFEIAVTVLFLLFEPIAPNKTTAIEEFYGNRGPIFFLLYSALIAPPWEEMVFRILPFVLIGRLPTLGLKKYCNITTTTWETLGRIVIFGLTLVWSLLHYSNTETFVNVFATFISGIFYYRLTIGHYYLAPILIIHAFNNFWAILLLMILMSLF